MLGFVQSWFGPRCNPIGIDFGSDSLRLAQVQWTGPEYKLHAAASADVPTTVRNDAAGRLAFFIENTRDLLAQGNFHGRQAVLALPASAMFVRHLRMPRLDDEQMKKSLPWELRGKLPIDPSHAVLRHVIAGEIYQEQEQKSEVIVIAAARELVNQLLAAAAKAKLDIVGMNIEPQAIVDCFNHVYRRKPDQESTTCYLDIGCTASRAVIARGADILFARVIPVGGDQFSRAVADALKIPLQEAKILRARLCSSAPASEVGVTRPSSDAAPPTTAPSSDNTFALLDNALKAERHASADAPSALHEPDDEAHAVTAACREPLARLVEELNLCRRYHESTFADKPIERIVFVGGEARQRALCQQVAQQLGLAAQIGDPLVRMNRISDIGVESGIDRRQPQPSWAVAIGLSMGPRQPTASARPAAQELNARG